MIVKVFTGPLNYTLDSIYTKDEEEYIIGVDQGCALLLEHKISIDLAIGDFDSIDQERYQEIKNSSTIKTYSEVKDYTDTYLAIKEALLLNPTSIIIYGGSGGRLDHTLANLKLLELGPITMINDTSKSYVLEPGDYELENDYTYISFFALEDVKKLSLTGFHYEVSDYDLQVEDPLCISNKGSGTISFVEGSLLVVHSKD